MLFFATQYGPRYAFTPYEQSSILGASYIGSTCAGIPLGLLFDRYDNFIRWYILGGYVLAGCLQLLTPWAAAAGAGAAVPLLIVVRVIIGMTQTAVYPAMHKMFTKWAPLTEMGRFTVALTGGNAGTIFSMAISGLVIERWGWEWTFRASAAAALVYAVAWWWQGYASPARHPRIRLAEREMIEASRRSVMGKAKVSA